METYSIRVTIENKPGISDPEGETILKDLVLMEQDAPVSEIRCSKGLRFAVSAESAEEAADRVLRICNDLRIYNPLVSRVTVSAE